MISTAGGTAEGRRQRLPVVLENISNQTLAKRVYPCF